MHPGPQHGAGPRPPPDICGVGRRHHVILGLNWLPAWVGFPDILNQTRGRTWASFFLKLVLFFANSFTCLFFTEA